MKKDIVPIQDGNAELVIQESDVANKIATIRKQPVIADADVADLYGVETRREMKPCETIQTSSPQIICLN